MNRRLILVCNPGSVSSGNLVAHVTDVLHRYKLFFQSPVGGYWQDNEIREMPHSLNDIEQLVWLEMTIKECNSAIVDYSMFIFIGHGGAFVDGEAFQLSKGKLAPIRCLLPAFSDTRSHLIKRLIIIDACRDFHNSTIPTLIEETRMYCGDSNIDGTICAELYNQIIENSKPHFELLQSTKYGEKAMVTTSGTVFSDAFFNTISTSAKIWNAQAISMPQGQFTRSLNEILPQVISAMNAYGQIPEYNTSDSTGNFPIYTVWRSTTKEMNYESAIL